MRTALTVAACALLTAEPAAAWLPPPPPPDPVAIAKAGELLDAVGYNDCVAHSLGVDFATKLVVERLMVVARPSITEPTDSDFNQLLAGTFKRQAHAAIAAMGPLLRTERTEHLARLLRPDELDEARKYFGGPGQRLARHTFCTVSSERFIDSIYPPLLAQIDKTIADVRQSYALMKQINNSGRRQ
jgi:hypothetical protein